jgi:quinol monooxygenase YgiN
MVFHSYIVAAEFHTRADAIEAMKQVVAEVTAPSLDEEGCHLPLVPRRG